MPPEGRSRNRVQLILRGQFARLWWAGALSSFGDWVELFATLALGASIGGSTGTLVPLLGRFIPGLLFTPLGGLIADRFNRKTIMISSDIGRGVLVLSLIFVSTLPQLFVVSFLVEMLSLARQPAREAAVPALVSERELVGANSLSVAAAYGTFPFGSLTWSAFGQLPAWVDMAAGSEWIFGYTLDSLTFFVSAALVASMRLDPPVVSRERESTGALDWRAPVRDLREGIRFVVTHRGVRVVIFGMATALFGGGALVALGQVFASNFLGGANSGFAILSTSLGAGVGLGVIAIGWIDRIPVHRTVTFGSAVALCGAAMASVAASTTVGGGALWAFLMGFSAGVAYVNGFTYIHERVDDELRGRTFAALFTVARTALLVSMTTAAFGAQLLDGFLPSPFNDGVRLVFLIGGLVIAGSGLATLWLVREVFQPPSEAGPDAPQEGSS